MRGISVITKNDPLTPVVFKFEGHIRGAIGLGLLVIMLQTMCIISIRQGHVRSAISVLWVGLWLCSILGTIAICGTSDLIINETGLSRQILGKTWQSIRWENVKLIRQFSMYHNDARRVVRGFHVFPAVYPKAFLGVLLWPTRKMVFSELVDNPDELINTLNYFIEKHNIKIEDKFNGTWRSASRVDVFKPEK